MLLKNPLFCKSAQRGCKLGIFMLKKNVLAAIRIVGGRGSSVKGGELAAVGDSVPGRPTPSLARAQIHGTHRS